MDRDDTIFSLSSAPGRAGVAVFRVSGPQAGPALEALVGRRPEPRRATLARLSDPGTSEAIDRALVLWFPAPRSFTGEDMAELHLHGGRAVVAAAVEALSRLPGLRPAEAGEFTRRAFDNDKLDLAEVEGLADLINAETEAQRRQALRQMDGALSRQTESWRARLVSALAHLEGAIDFPDEDLPADLVGAVKRDILWVSSSLTQYLEDDRRGERLREGLYIAIIGPPNAGKSSLLNALARRPVAIVSETAGTTRDVIEVHLDLGGYPVTLADTAGLREVKETADVAGQDSVEREGMRRARAGAAGADLKLAVFDLRDAPDFDRATLDLLDRDSLVILNKLDLVAEPECPLVGDHLVLPISVKTGAGLGELLARLETEVAGRLAAGRAAPALTRARHRQAVQDCAAALARARDAALPELMAEDLRLGVRALGRITGRVDVEDILDVIFRDFCIGK